MATVGRSSPPSSEACAANDSDSAIHWVYQRVCNGKLLSDSFNKEIEETTIGKDPFSLSISESAMMDRGASRLASIFSTNFSSAVKTCLPCSLTSLQLSAVLITDDGLKEVSRIMSYCSKLRSLDLSKNKFSAAAVGDFVKSINNLKCLERIVVPAMLPQGRSKETINHEQCTLLASLWSCLQLDGQSKCIVLSRNIEWNKGKLVLLNIDLSSNGYESDVESAPNNGNRSVHCVRSILLSPSILMSELSLSNCNCDDLSLDLLFGGLLKQSETLLKLSIPRNALPDSSVAKLSNFLQHAKKLTHLNLDYNLAPVSSLSPLVSVLFRSCPFLQHFSARCIALPSEDRLHLLRLLLQRRSLHDLQFFRVDGIELHAMLENCSFLSVSNFDFSDGVWLNKLVDVLLQNNWLTSLKFRQCRFAVDKCVMHFHRLVSVSRSLRGLEIINSASEELWDSQRIDQLKQAMAESISVQSLRLDNAVYRAEADDKDTVDIDDDFVDNAEDVDDQVETYAQFDEMQQQGKLFCRSRVADASSSSFQQSSVGGNVTVVHHQRCGGVILLRKDLQAPQRPVQVSSSNTLPVVYVLRQNHLKSESKFFQYVDLALYHNLKLGGLYYRCGSYSDEYMSPDDILQLSNYLCGFWHPDEGRLLNVPLRILHVTHLPEHSLSQQAEFAMQVFQHNVWCTMLEELVIGDLVSLSCGELTINITSDSMFDFIQTPGSLCEALSSWPSLSAIVVKYPQGVTLTMLSALFESLCSASSISSLTVNVVAGTVLEDLLVVVAAACKSNSYLENMNILVDRDFDFIMKGDVVCITNHRVPGYVALTPSLQLDASSGSSQSRKIAVERWNSECRAQMTVHDLPSWSYPPVGSAAAHWPHCVLSEQAVQMANGAVVQYKAEPAWMNCDHHDDQAHCMQSWSINPWRWTTQVMQNFTSMLDIMPLTVLQLVNLRLTDHDFAALFAHLRSSDKLRSLTHVDFSYNLLSDVSLCMIADAFKELLTLHALHWTGNTSTTTTGRIKFLSYIASQPRHSYLKFLCISASSANCTTRRVTTAAAALCSALFDVLAVHSHFKTAIVASNVYYDDHLLFISYVTERKHQQILNALVKLCQDRSTVISRLILAHNNLVDADVMVLAQVIDAMDTVHCVDISHNQISNLGMNALLETMWMHRSHLHSRSVLHASFNGLGFKVPLLGKALRQCPTGHVQVVQVDMPTHSSVSLSSRFTSQLHIHHSHDNDGHNEQVVTHLHVSSSHTVTLSPQQSTIWSRFTETPPQSAVQVAVTGHDLSSPGDQKQLSWCIDSFSGSFKQTLSLSLAHCQLHDDFFLTCARQLLWTLSLDLTNTQLGDQRALLLDQALPTLHIERLILADNRLTSVSAEALFTTISRCSAIKHVSLAGNHIAGFTCPSLLHEMRTRWSPLYLDLQRCELGDDEARWLISWIDHVECCLQGLNLGDNALISAVESGRLLQTLCHNVGIQCLVLDGMALPAFMYSDSVSVGDSDDYEYSCGSFAGCKWDWSVSAIQRLSLRRCHMNSSSTSADALLEHILHSQAPQLHEVDVSCIMHRHDQRILRRIFSALEQRTCPALHTLHFTSLPDPDLDSGPHADDLDAAILREAEELAKRLNITIKLRETKKKRYAH